MIEVTKALENAFSAGGAGSGLFPVLEQVKRNLSVGRIKSLAYDEAADTNAVHESPSWAPKKFERLYRGQTAVERVNARLKVVLGSG